MLIKFALSLHVILRFSAHSVSGQLCRTIPTSGGTLKSEPCVFPFTYKGRRFNRCTSVSDPHKKLWCSVQVDSSGFHITGGGRWGHCDRSCFNLPGRSKITTTRRPVVSTAKTPLRRKGTKLVPARVTRVPQTTAVTLRRRTTTTPPPPPTTTRDDLNCVTVSGPASNHQCVFPFIFEGVKYSRCIPEGKNPQLSWCSTKVDSFGRHVKDHWGHCFCTNKEGCPDVKFDELVTASPSGSHLSEKHEANFRCGVSRLPNENVKFVIGGRGTQLQEFPFNVLLIYKIPGRQNNNPWYLCSGVLINRRYVLTAAHCTHTTPIKVRLGDYDVSKDCDCLNGKCAPMPQTIDVEDVKVHDRYNATLVTYDIALIRMARPAVLNAGVGVVCMPDASLRRSLVGENLMIMGWGRNVYFSNGRLLEIGTPVSVIQKVEVPIIDQFTCKSQYPDREVDHKIICAGKIGADSCKGDSGAPMVYRAGPGDPWTLIGIVSYGAAVCGGGKAGIYTDVRHFMNWIKANLKD